MPELLVPAEHLLDAAQAALNPDREKPTIAERLEHVAIWNRAWNAIRRRELRVVLEEAEFCKVHPYYSGPEPITRG